MTTSSPNLIWKDYVATNTSFSKEIPGLQIAWDSTSLGALKECPRKYFYVVILGLGAKEENVHLRFGIEYHSALEDYDHERAAGKDHEEATRKCIHNLLINSQSFVSDDHYKNRDTLVRTVAWYLEEFKEDPAKTVILANGKAAVELSFKLDFDVKSITNEDYLVCGHLDRLVEFQGSKWILDRKTTKSGLYPEYFEKYSPNPQMSQYTYAGNVVLNQNVKGIIIDAAQVGVNFSRFQRGITYRDQAQLAEWRHDTISYIKQAEGYAEQEYWPMNDKSCDNYGGCTFRSICSKSPSVRETFLGNLHQRQWDPMVPR